MMLLAAASAAAPPLRSGSISMIQTDLEGRVRRLPRNHSKPLLPVFEAISNARHAIAERGTGQIRIVIDRKPALGRAEGSEIDLGDIDGFTVEDGGIGFNDRHLDSFRTLDSRAKESVGGKGVGRLQWLTAFDHAKIESTISIDGRWVKRSFRFSLHDTGTSDVEELVLDGAAPTEPLTRVKLCGLKKQPRDAVPKQLDTIARHIIEHFIVEFALQTFPEVRVVDPQANEQRDLNAIFRRDFDPEQEAQTLNVGGHELRLDHMLVRSNARLSHATVWTAHKLVVLQFPLKGVPHLESAIEHNGHKVTYLACLSGALLDDRVVDSRTDFNIPHSRDLPEEGTPSREEIQEAVRSAAEKYLTPITADRRDEALARARTLIESEAPHLRQVLENRRELVERLSPSLDSKEYRRKLEVISAEYRLEESQAAQATIAAAIAQPGAMGRLHEEAKAAVAKLTELQQSDLAEYVLYRDIVLNYLHDLLRRRSDGKSTLESQMHEVVFPLRRTSAQVDESAHNLWLLSDALAYHRFLASDLPLKQQHDAPVNAGGDQRPDLLVYPVAYDNALAFNEGTPREQPIVIVEFKRPEREDGGNQPLKQCFDYMDEIIAGKARDFADRRITVDPKFVRFFCYIITHISDAVRTECIRASLQPGFDDSVYQGYNDKYRAYFEVMSWEHLITDAQRRNRAFLRKLNPTA